MFPLLIRHILRLKSSPSLASLKGIAVHEVLSRFFTLEKGSRDLKHLHEQFREVMTELVLQDNEVQCRPSTCTLRSMHYLLKGNMIKRSDCCGSFNVTPEFVVGLLSCWPTEGRTDGGSDFFRASTRMRAKASAVDHYSLSIYCSALGASSQLREQTRSTGRRTRACEWHDTIVCCRVSVDRPKG